MSTKQKRLLANVELAAQKAHEEMEREFETRIEQLVDSIVIRYGIPKHSAASKAMNLLNKIRMKRDV
jgi:hypothetical protein